MNNQVSDRKQTEEQQRTHIFNPSEHLIQLKSREGAKDYLPVQWRLVWFREQCPQGTIDTEEVNVDLDREVEEEAYVWNNEKRRSEKVIKHAKGYARFRATVTDGKGGRATGTKSENAASFPDFIEKAETGAIGRALAALGYGTQFAPEMDEAHRIVDSPVEQQRQSAGNGQGGFNNRVHGGTANNSSNGYGNGANGNGVARLTENGGAANNHSNNGHANGNGANGNAAARSDESEAAATEQQLASIRKLSEHLGKAAPEDGSLNFLSAKKVIQQLTAEYREAKQNSKAS